MKNNFPLRGVIGALLFIANLIRSDIVAAVSYLSQYLDRVSIDMHLELFQRRIEQLRSYGSGVTQQLGNFNSYYFIFCNSGIYDAFLSCRFPLIKKFKFSLSLSLFLCFYLALYLSLFPAHTVSMPFSISNIQISYKIKPHYD